MPIVVDADALNALAVDLAPLRRRQQAGLPPAVLTPHAGEYGRLAGAPVGDDRVDAARSLAARTHAIVLLKGPGTVIASPAGDAVVNRTDIPALATAGTGDVLTGIISRAHRERRGAVRSCGDRRVRARAGRQRCRRTGPELVATDLVAALHPTLEALRSGRDPWEE